MSGGLGSRTTAPEAYLQDADFTLYQGDALEVLRSLPDGLVHCVVTSPPYWGLRDYGTGSWEGGNSGCDHVQGMARGDGGRLSTDDRPGINPAPVDTPLRFRETCGKCGATRVDNQLGLEPTPDLYLERMVAVFREVRRVLRADGTAWVNMGDSYAASRSYQVSDPKHKAHDFAEANAQAVPPGLKPKDLCMVPARLAIALQADGWWLRSQIVWSKPNPMPESVTDRPTTSHEFVYLLAKSKSYFFDQEAVREPAEFGRREWTDTNGNMASAGGGRGHATVRGANPESGRNLRSVWEIPTQPYPDAHFATYPEELVRRCILAGCPEGGTVLDPFVGSGTTALVARKHGRNCVGIELSGDYCALAARRLQQLSLLPAAT